MKVLRLKRNVCNFTKDKFCHDNKMHSKTIREKGIYIISHATASNRRKNVTTVFSHSPRHMCAIYIMPPPFRCAISHRVTRLTKYSRRTDIITAGFFSGVGGERGDRTWEEPVVRGEFGCFFTRRRAFKVGVAHTRRNYRRRSRRDRSRGPRGGRGAECEAVGF